VAQLVPQLEQLSQVITSQQSFFLRENRLQRFFGFSQQHESQVGWQHEVAPQHDDGQQVGAEQVGAQLVVQQLGAQLDAHVVVQAGTQLITSQQQSLLLRCFFCLQGCSQHGAAQQSLTAPHEPPQLPQEAATGTTAAGAAGTGFAPALTVVSSMINTFTGVILR